MTRLNEEQSFGTNDVLCSLSNDVLSIHFRSIASYYVLMSIYAFSFLFSFFNKKNCVIIYKYSTNFRYLWTTISN